MKKQLWAALAVSVACGVALAQGEKPADGRAPEAKQPEVKPETKPTGEKPAQEKLQYVRFETTEGPFVLELNHEKAPVTVENFMKYVDKGFYNGTVFHRVIADFVVQGGGMDAEGKPKKTDKPIVNEHSNGLTNKRGTISMARLPDPDSATSQFFINVADNDGTGTYNLDTPPGYAVFGKVVHGMDVIEKIRTGKVRGSAPINPVAVTKAARITKDEADQIVKEAKDNSKPAEKPAPNAGPKQDPKNPTNPEKKK